jgi:hypothetical protein
MRTGALIGYKHGKEDGEIIGSASSNLDKLKGSFKAYRAAGVDAVFGRVELWLSDEGVSRRAKLDKPKPAEKVEAPAKK